MFKQECDDFFKTLGICQKMVLSTCLNNKVTSRMMSIVIIEQKFYFQTDITLRKYDQISQNNNVSLCFDNVQIDGICKELGKPCDNHVFCEIYKNNFNNAYRRYTNLNNERLFSIEPIYIEKWIYENNSPYMEIFNFESQTYCKNLYVSK